MQSIIADSSLCVRSIAVPTGSRAVRNARPVTHRSQQSLLNAVPSTSDRQNHLLVRRDIVAAAAAVAEKIPATEQLMKTVEVPLGDRSYPIYIGQGLLDQGELLQRHVPGKRVLIVTNETVAPLYLERYSPQPLVLGLLVILLIS